MEEANCNIDVLSLRRLTDFCDKGDVEEEEEDLENVRVNAGLAIVYDQAVTAFSEAETALLERETVVTDSHRDGLSGEITTEAASDCNNDSFVTCNSSSAEGTPRVLEDNTKADANQVTFIFEANPITSEDVKTQLKTIDPNFTSISQVNLESKTQPTSLSPRDIGSSNTPEGAEQETQDIIEENRSNQSVAEKFEDVSSLEQSECLDYTFLTTVLPSYGSQGVLTGVESQNVGTKNILQASPNANDRLETPHYLPQSFETQYSERLTHTRGFIADVNLSPLEKGQQVDGIVFYPVPDLLEEGNNARLENVIETMEGVFEVKAVETGEASSAITLTEPELIKNDSFAQPELVPETKIGLINQQEPVFLQEVQDDHSTSVDLENYAREPAALTAQQEIQEVIAAALIEEYNKKEHDRSLHERISSTLSDLKDFQEKLSRSTEPTYVSSEKLTNKERAKIDETFKTENLSQNAKYVVSPSSLTSIALLMDAANSNCSSCFGDANEEASCESKETEKALELSLVVNTGAATGAIAKKTNSIADELKILCGIALESLHSQMPATAIDKYERVIHILQAVSSQVRKDFKVDLSCVRYGLASSLRMSGTYNHFVRALQIYQKELARQTDFPRLTLIWAVAMVYYALFRFEKAKECLKAVEWSNCETCEEQDKSVRCWPGSKEAIPETEVNMLKYMVSELEDHCASAPLPDAVCALSNCLALQQHVIPSKFIYKSDPDYRGCVEVFCEAKCHFHYHPICWKNFKESRSDKPIDKSFLSKVCWTPDCFANVIKICIIDSQGVEKTRLVAEAEMQIEQAVKPKKSKLAKKAEQRESAKDSAKEKRKEKNAKKEHTTEHVSQSKDIEEEATRTTIPPANEQVELSIPVVKKKKKSKASQLPKLATSKILNHPFSYSASRNAPSSSSSASTTAGNVSALSNWEEIGKVDHAPFESSSSRASFPPNYCADKEEFVEIVNQEVKRTKSVDHIQEGLYSFILDFLNDNGPVCVDSEDLWNFIALLPEEAQDFLRGPEELITFLLVNHDFVMVENVIATACDFHKAFQLALSISDRNQNVRGAAMGAMSVDLRASNYGIKASQVPPLEDTLVAQASFSAVFRENGLLDEEEDDTYHNTDSENESELERLRGNSQADTESLASNVLEFQESKNKPEAVIPLYSHFREELATSKVVEMDVTRQGGQVDTYQNTSVEIASSETTMVENTEFESPRSVSSSPETTTSGAGTLNPTAPVYAPANSMASSLKNQKIPDETDKVENVQPVLSKHATNFYEMLQTDAPEAILQKSKTQSLPVGNETSKMYFQPKQHVRTYPMMHLLNNPSVSTTANFSHGQQYCNPPPSLGIVHRHPPRLELGYPIMPNNFTMPMVANEYILEIETLKENTEKSNQLLYTRVSELQARILIVEDKEKSNMAHEKREVDLLQQIERLTVDLDKANKENKACEIELATISKESEERYKSTLVLQAELDKVNKEKKACEIVLATISKESEERYKNTLLLQVELDKCKERLYFSEIAKAQMMGALQQSVVMGMAGQNMAAQARMVQLNCPVSVPQPQSEEKISSRPNLNVPTTASSTLSSKQSQTSVSSVDQPAAPQNSLPQGFATMLTLLGRRFPEQKKDDLRTALQNVLAANGNKFRNLTRDTIFMRVEALLIKPQPKEATPDECSICFHALTPCATKLSCGHYFHANCIGEWFHTNTSCPLCRRLEVPESDFPPLC